MLGLSGMEIAVVALCAFATGLTKTGLPGLSILVVPTMAMVLPAKQSVGALLGILILADLFAAGFHRKNAVWSHIFKLLPAALAGILLGYFLIDYISNDALKPIIGTIVLIMLGIAFWRNTRDDVKVPESVWFGLLMGFAAGVTTMLANAAGPVMILYLIAMKLPKHEFVGTRAWFFFVVNWIKVPFSFGAGMMTLETVKFDLVMLPAIAVGAVTGIYLLKKIPQKTFKIAVQLLAAGAAVKLIF